ncbi:MAG: MBL fold metallo-hydrolase [Candidatus Micrarchaeota archaeon]
MKIAFLGTNGWYSTKTGNTISTAIVARDRLIVLDAGDGFAKVPEFAKKEKKKKIDDFLSHLHLDHSAGLHALPMFGRGQKVRIFASFTYMKDVEYLLDHPFTANLKQLNCKVEILPIKTGENALPYSVIALPLIHADPCLGFRFELEGKIIAYCTDTGSCDNIPKLGKEADVLITECSLLPRAKPLKNWPHLSPEIAARLAREAKAKLVVLDHFDANNYREMNDRRKAEKAARNIFKNTIAAKDGLILEI